jgi:hypothetical protein
MAKAKTTAKRAAARKTKPASKRKSIKDGPVWPTRPYPKVEPGPNAEAITAAIKQFFEEKSRR